MRSIAGGRIILLSIIYDFVFFSGIAWAANWLNVLSTVFAAVKYGNDMINRQFHILPSTTKAFVTVKTKDGVPFFNRQISAIACNPGATSRFIVSNLFLIVLSPVFSVLRVFVAPSYVVVASTNWVFLCPVFRVSAICLSMCFSIFGVRCFDFFFIPNLPFLYRPVMALFTS
jgi:hypothetical protein